MINDIFAKKLSEYGISPLPENPVEAMAYVPYQQPGYIYNTEQGFKTGTLFPSLDKPFLYAEE